MKSLKIGQYALNEKQFKLLHCDDLHVFLMAPKNEKLLFSGDGSQPNGEFNKSRREKLIETHIQKLKNLLKDGNFDSFVETIIQDSNQYDAVRMDSNPPLLRMNEFRNDLINLVLEYNKQSKYGKIGYTFENEGFVVILAQS